MDRHHGHRIRTDGWTSDWLAAKARRAINGEVRLWVNGEEVSGGNGCDPASGYLCLDSEGSPIQFRKLRIRELT